MDSPHRNLPLVSVVVRPERDYREQVVDDHDLDYDHDNEYESEYQSDTFNLYLSKPIIFGRRAHTTDNPTPGLVTDAKYNFEFPTISREHIRIELVENVDKTDPACPYFVQAQRLDTKLGVKINKTVLAKFDHKILSPNKEYKISFVPVPWDSAVSCPPYPNGLTFWLRYEYTPSSFSKAPADLIRETALLRPVPAKEHSVSFKPFAEIIPDTMPGAFPLTDTTGTDKDTTANNAQKKSKSAVDKIDVQTSTTSNLNARGNQTTNVAPTNLRNQQIAWAAELQAKVNQQEAEQKRRKLLLDELASRVSQKITSTEDAAPKHAVVDLTSEKEDGLFGWGGAPLVSSTDEAHNIPDTISLVDDFEEDEDTPELVHDSDSGPEMPAESSPSAKEPANPAPQTSAPANHHVEEPVLPYFGPFDPPDGYKPYATPHPSITQSTDDMMRMCGVAGTPGYPVSSGPYYTYTLPSAGLSSNLHDANPKPAADPAWQSQMSMPMSSYTRFGPMYPTQTTPIQVSSYVYIPIANSNPNRFDPTPAPQRAGPDFFEHPFNGGNGNRSASGIERSRSAMPPDAEEFHANLEREKEKKRKEQDTQNSDPPTHTQNSIRPEQDARLSQQTQTGIEAQPQVVQSQNTETTNVDVERRAADSPRNARVSPEYVSAGQYYKVIFPSGTWGAEHFPSLSPGFSARSPQYDPGSPGYEPISPQYDPGSPGYEPISPQYDPGSPHYSPTSPNYSPTSGNWSPASIGYAPTSPQFSPSSVNNETGPRWAPTTPQYEPREPVPFFPAGTSLWGYPRPARPALSIAVAQPVQQPVQPPLGVNQAVDNTRMKQKMSISSLTNPDDHAQVKHVEISQVQPENGDVIMWSGCKDSTAPAQITSQEIESAEQTVEEFIRRTDDLVDGDESYVPTNDVAKSMQPVVEDGSEDENLSADDQCDVEVDDQSPPKDAGESKDAVVEEDGSAGEELAPDHRFDVEVDEDVPEEDITVQDEWNDEIDEGSNLDADLTATVPHDPSFEEEVESISDHSESVDSDQDGSIDYSEEDDVSHESYDESDPSDEESSGEDSDSNVINIDNATIDTNSDSESESSSVDESYDNGELVSGSEFSSDEIPHISVNIENAHVYYDGSSDSEDISDSESYDEEEGSESDSSDESVSSDELSEPDLTINIANARINLNGAGEDESSESGSYDDEVSEAESAESLSDADSSVVEIADPFHHEDRNTHGMREHNSEDWIYDAGFPDDWQEESPDLFDGDSFIDDDDSDGFSIEDESEDEEDEPAENDHALEVEIEAETLEPVTAGDSTGHVGASRFARNEAHAPNLRVEFPLGGRYLTLGEAQRDAIIASDALSTMRAFDDVLDDVPLMDDSPTFNITDKMAELHKRDIEIEKHAAEERKRVEKSVARQIAIAKAMALAEEASVQTLNPLAEEQKAAGKKRAAEEEDERPAKKLVPGNEAGRINEAVNEILKNKSKRISDVTTAIQNLRRHLDEQRSSSKKRAAEEDVRPAKKLALSPATTTASIAPIAKPVTPVPATATPVAVYRPSWRQRIAKILREQARPSRLIQCAAAIGLGVLVAHTVNNIDDSVIQEARREFVHELAAKGIWDFDFRF